MAKRKKSDKETTKPAEVVVPAAAAGLTDEQKTCLVALLTWIKTPGSVLSEVRRAHRAHIPDEWFAQVINDCRPLLLQYGYATQEELNRYEVAHHAWLDMHRKGWRSAKQHG